jgi:AcrR family transcriptional regulator
MSTIDEVQTGAGPRPKARRTQSERREASQRKLLDAATELVARQGTARTSLTEVAGMAGCSRGLPTYLFGSKQGLLLAMADDIVERFRVRRLDPAVGDRTGLAALIRHIELYIEALRQPPATIRAAVTLIGEALGSQPDLLPAVNNLHATARVMIERYITDGIERGDIRGDVDAAAQAAILTGTLRGISLLALTDPAGLDLDAVSAELAASTRRSLAAP